MTEKQMNDIFYVCSLIEYIARKTKNHRQDVIRCFSKKDIEHQLYAAEVNHCLSFEQVSEELIDWFNIPIAAARAQHRLAADAHVQNLPLIQRHDRKTRRRATGSITARRTVLLLESLRLALHLLGELTRERLFARGGLLVHLGEDLRQEFFV